MYPYMKWYFTTHFITGFANENEAQSSYVFVKGPAIFKIDYYIFNRRTSIEVKGVVKSTNITSVAYVLSCVDCGDLHMYDFNSIVVNKRFYRKGTKEVEDDEDTLFTLQVEYAKKLAEANGVLRKSDQAIEGPVKSTRTSLFEEED